MSFSYRLFSIISIVLVCVSNAVDEIINIDDSFSSSSINCTVEGSNCYVNCTGDSVCGQWWELYAEKSNNVYLTCSGNEACEYLEIYTQKSNNLYINCSGLQSCRDLQIYSPISDDSNLDITCNSTDDKSSWIDSACNSLSIFADNTKNINIECLNKWDCYFSIFNVSNSYNVNIQFYGNETGAASEIYATNVRDSFHVTCNGELACYRTDIYCPLSEYETTCDIDCLYDGSCSWMSYYIESSEYEYLEISCSSFIEDNCFDYIFEPEIVCLDTGYDSDITYNELQDKVECDDYSWDDETCCPYNLSSSSSWSLLMSLVAVVAFAFTG